MIVLDLETNSHNSKDVLEVCALKIEKQGIRYVIIDTFHRYYHSKYQVNFWALDVHNLSPEKIKKLRKGVRYAKYFKDDYDFEAFCKGSTTLIAHNTSFELRYLDGMVLFANHFCTMSENKGFVCALNRNGNLKNPKLIETCKYYKISFENNQYHSALYDAQKALEILNKMNNPENNYDVVSSSIEKKRKTEEVKNAIKNKQEENKIKREQNKAKRISKRTQWSGLTCPQCSSESFTLRGKRLHKYCRYQRFRCNDCMKIFSEKINEDGTPVNFIHKFTSSTTSYLIGDETSAPKSEKSEEKSRESKKQAGMKYIVLKTPKDSELIERIRSIPGRKWDSNTVSWKIPFREDYLQFLESKIGDIAVISCRNKCGIFHSKTIRVKITLTRPASYNIKGSSSEGCYIATAVYGSYDAPEVLILRKYRDTVLRKNLFGKYLISLYYTISPSIAKKLNGNKFISNAIKQIMDKFVRVIGQI